MIWGKTHYFRKHPYKLLNALGAVITKWFICFWWMNHSYSCCQFPFLHESFPPFVKLMLSSDSPMSTMFPRKWSQKKLMWVYHSQSIETHTKYPSREIPKQRKTYWEQEHSPPMLMLMRQCSIPSYRYAAMPLCHVFSWLFDQRFTMDSCIMNDRNNETWTMNQHLCKPC